MSQEHLAFAIDLDQLLQDITIPRGFCVWTDDIFSNGSWSDPVFFDAPGIDQDVSPVLRNPDAAAVLIDGNSYSLTTMARLTFRL